MTTNAFRSLHESPRGYNYRFVIDHTDLTTSADNTVQDITLITLPANSVVKSAATYLKTPFKETAATAYDNNVLIVGDSGDTARFIASQQLNENGTEITAKAQDVTKVPHAYAASTAVVARFASMAAYSLADLDAGEVQIFLEVAQLDTLT
jgi:NADPH-dependent glutamate synthase beta subunit-like oxidoreductase